MSPPPVLTTPPLPLALPSSADRGEPTPYSWPDINSHFGIVDVASFSKDRTAWYTAWFMQPKPTPALWVFPPWDASSANAAGTIDVWSFSNADEVELFVNGVSAGRKAMPQYGHAEWDAIPYAPGAITAVAYVAGAAAATLTRNTTGPAVALRASIQDGFGATLYATCVDVARVAVEVVDAAGLVVPTASHNVTFTVTGPGAVKGTGNGDPACLVNNLSPTRPAYHGMVMAVVAAGDATGTITVAVSADGLMPSQVTIPVVLPDASVPEAWCHRGPRL